MKKTVSTAIVSLALAATLSGCAGYQTSQQQGTAIGAGVGAGLGAVLGQAIGRDHQATLWGAGIGAALGGLTGNQVGLYMDRQEQELRNVIAASEAASLQRDQNILTATLRGEAYFDTNSSALTPVGYNEIARIASVINRYPGTSIQVAGHTDNRGSEQYNQRLSLQRAESVKNVLIQQGVNPSRISTIGFGASQPVSSHRALNRRAEIRIIPMG